MFPRSKFERAFARNSQSGTCGQPNLEIRASTDIYDPCPPTVRPPPDCSTERLLFGPSLRTSLPPVCSAAAVDRLVLPPSYLRLADDSARGDGSGEGRSAAAAAEAAPFDVYGRGFGHNHVNSSPLKESLFVNPGGVVGVGGNRGESGSGGGGHSEKGGLYGHDSGNVDSGGGSLDHDGFEGGNIDDDGAGDFDDGDDHSDNGGGGDGDDNDAVGGGAGGAGGRSFFPRSYRTGSGNSVPDPRYLSARKHALQAGRVRTGARTRPGRGDRADPPRPAPGYRGAHGVDFGNGGNARGNYGATNGVSARGNYGGTRGGNFGGTNGGHIRGNSGGNARGNYGGIYGGTNGGNTRGNYGRISDGIYGGTKDDNDSGNHGGTSRSNSRGLATARPRGERDRGVRGIGVAAPMAR